MQIENLDQVRAWCESNDAVLDVPLSKPSKEAEKVIAKVQEVIEKEISNHHSSGRSVVIVKDGKMEEVPPTKEHKTEKKQKSPKREENDSSGKL